MYLLYRIPLISWHTDLICTVSQSFSFGQAKQARSTAATVRLAHFSCFVYNKTTERIHCFRPPVCHENNVIKGFYLGLPTPGWEIPGLRAEPGRGKCGKGAEQVCPPSKAAICSGRNYFYSLKTNSGTSLGPTWTLATLPLSHGLTLASTGWPVQVTALLLAGLLFLQRISVTTGQSHNLLLKLQTAKSQRLIRSEMGLQ